MSIEKAYKAFAGAPPINGHDYENTVSGLASYMKDLNVRFFSVREVVTPYQKKVASRFGYSVLLPPQDMWAGLGLVLLVADVGRAAVNPRKGPPGIRLRNAYRPLDYNEAVGGAPSSSHIHALGVDLDFKEAAHARLAEGAFRALEDRYPELRLALGIGKKTINVDVGTDKGTRTWGYGVWGRSRPKKAPPRRIRSIV